MKKIILLVMILTGVLTCVILASPGQFPNETNNNLKAPIAEPLQRGCCSWHNGVCGCDSYGRVMCCDGSTSPSCRCN